MSIEVGATGPATLTFDDASGNPAAPPTGDGSGLVVTITSSDVTIATVGPVSASGDTATAEVTAVAVGTYTLSATVANTSGVELFDDDGTTAFVQPSSVTGTVTAAPVPQAVTATLTAP